MTLKQRGELLDSEERLLGYKKDLAELKIRETDARAQFIEQNAKIARLQLETLENEAEQIRKELRIDKKDMLTAQNAVKNQITESNRMQEDLAKRIESLNLLRQTEINQINQIKQRYRLPENVIDALYHWTYHPSTIGDWNALIEIGRIHNHILYEIDIHKEMLSARMEQEKAKVAESETNAAIIQTWYILTTGKFDGYHSVLSSLKKYSSMKR